MLILVLAIVMLLAFVAWIYTGPQLSGPVAVISFGLWPAGVYSWRPAMVLTLVFLIGRIFSYCIEHDIDTPFG